MALEVTSSNGTMRIIIVLPLSMPKSPQLLIMVLLVSGLGTLDFLRVSISLLQYGVCTHDCNRCARVTTYKYLYGDPGDYVCLDPLPNFVTTLALRDADASVVIGQ